MIVYCLEVWYRATGHVQTFHCGSRLERGLTAIMISVYADILRQYERLEP